MPPKVQPKAKAQPRPPTTDQRKRQASNADQQPSKRTRRNTKNTKEDENEDEEDPNPWPEIEEEIASKSKGKKAGRAPGGTRGQAKKAPARRYVLLFLNHTPLTPFFRKTAHDRNKEDAEAKTPLDSDQTP
jgi:hypothetical protein